MTLVDTRATALGLVDRNCVSEGEPEYLILTTEQVRQYDTKVLRRLAAATESDRVNGKSTRLEMVSFLAGQRTLRDYERR